MKMNFVIGLLMALGLVGCDNTPPSYYQILSSENSCAISIDGDVINLSQVAFYNKIGNNTILFTFKYTDNIVSVSDYDPKQEYVIYDKFVECSKQ